MGSQFTPGQQHPARGADLVSRSCEQKNIAKCGFILDAASLLRRTTAAESPRRCHQAPAHLSSWRTISSSAPMAAPSVIAMSSMRRNCLGRGQPCATRPAPPRRRGFRGTGKSAVVAQEGFGSEPWNTMNDWGAFCRANDKSCTTSHLSLARSMPRAISRRTPSGLSTRFNAGKEVV